MRTTSFAFTVLAATAAASVRGASPKVTSTMDGGLELSVPGATLTLKHHECPVNLCEGPHVKVDGDGDCVPDIPAVWPPAGFQGVVGFFVDCDEVSAGVCNPFRPVTVQAIFTDAYPVSPRGRAHIFACTATDPAGEIEIVTTRAQGLRATSAGDVSCPISIPVSAMSSATFGPLEVSVVLFGNEVSFAGKEPFGLMFSAPAATVMDLPDLVLTPGESADFEVKVGQQVSRLGHEVVKVTSSDSEIVNVGDATDIIDDTAFLAGEDYHAITRQALVPGDTGEAKITVEVTDIFGNTVETSFNVKVSVASAPTCFHFLQQEPNSKNGVYLLTPESRVEAVEPFDAYCDMENGGWTLVVKVGTKDKYFRSKYETDPDSPYHIEDLLTGPRANGDCGQQCDRPELATSATAEGGTDQSGRLAAKQMNALAEVSTRRGEDSSNLGNGGLTRWDVGYKTWYVQKKDRSYMSHSHWDFYQSVFPTNDGADAVGTQWGPSKGVDYEVYKSESHQEILTHVGLQTCVHGTISVVVGDDAHGLLGDPCGYGGCCWISDGPHGVTGVGGCQGCSPRGEQNGYFWIL